MKNETDWLVHHGVKGMRWHVSKARNKSNSSSMKTRKRALTPEQRKKKAKKAIEKAKRKELRKAFAYQKRTQNKTVFGDIFDRLSGADKIYADTMINLSNSSEKKKALDDYYKTHYKKK